jgi:hypothetical protein
MRKYYGPLKSENSEQNLFHTVRKKIAKIFIICYEGECKFIYKKRQGCGTTADPDLAF